MAQQYIWTGKRISKPHDKSRDYAFKITEKWTKKNKQSLREMWDTIKHTNICATVILKGEEREREKTFEEIMAENFPNLKKALIYTRK